MICDLARIARMQKAGELVESLAVALFWHVWRFEF